MKNKAKYVRRFTLREMEGIAAMIADSLELSGPCHCAGDPGCKGCEDIRSLVRKFAPVTGVCMFCLCTEESPCETARPDGVPGSGPCAWADPAHTICSNPDCIATAQKELGLSVANRARKYVAKMYGGVAKVGAR
jgi:hypothetical protein